MASTLEEELRSAKLPLWLALPETPRYSVGWRLGAGEDYAHAFGEWWQALSLAAQQEYQRRYPEPAGWLGWYSDEDLEEEDLAEGLPD